LESSPGSELFVAVAWGVGWSACLVILVLFVLIHAVRRLRIAGEQRRHRLLTVWRPLLMSALTDTNPPLPVVARRDRHVFLLLWNHLHESLRGEAKFGLNRIALRLGMERDAREFTRSSDVRDRLVGALTLGNLRDPGAWDELLDLATHAPGPTGLAAARALFRIDAARAARVLVPRLGARQDWSRTQVLALLREAGSAVVSEPLARVLATAPSLELARLLELSVAATPATVRPIVLRRLRQSRDPEVMAACLRQLRDPRDLDVLREHLQHPVWFVRGQALRQLGRHASAEDAPVLLRLLDDPEWWVRLRAAEILLDLGLAPNDLAAASPDGRALLDRIRAERGAA
jgi:HEAT repeat protein